MKPTRTIAAALVAACAACAAPQDISQNPLVDQLQLKTTTSRFGDLRRVEVRVRRGARADLTIAGLDLTVIDDLDRNGQHTEGEPEWYRKGRGPYAAASWAYGSLGSAGQMRNPILFATAHTSLGDVVFPATSIR